MRPLVGKMRWVQPRTAQGQHADSDVNGRGRSRHVVDVYYTTGHKRAAAGRAHDGTIDTLAWTPVDQYWASGLTCRRYGASDALTP